MQSTDETLDQIFVPRPSIPLVPASLPPLPSQLPASKPPPPKLAYQIIQKPNRSSISVRDIAQQNIQQELTELHKRSLSLDELIQKAINVKVQHDYQGVKPPSLPQTKPIIQPQPKVEEKQFWWPEEKEIKKVPWVRTEPKPPARVVPPVKTRPIPITPPPPLIKKQTQMVTTPTPVKTNLESGSNLINYLLFSISDEEDPYRDPNRRKVIYAFKLLGYLVLIAAIFETRRYLKLGMSIYGLLEIGSIVFISGLLFFFGENFNILFKPVNPYQVQEIV